MDNPIPTPSTSDTYGTPLAEFDANGRKFHQQAVGSGVSGVLLLLLGTLILSNDGIKLWGSNVVFIIVWLTIPALIIAGIVIYYWWLACQWDQMRLVIYPQGLLWIQPKKELFFAWQDIVIDQASVRDLSRGKNYTRGPNRYVYLLHFNTGKTLGLDASVEDVDNLGKLIQRHIADAKYPQALKQLRAGETLHFGRIRMDEAGLRRGRKSISWPEIRQVQCRESYVKIDPHEGKSWSLDALAFMPDAALFLTLAQKMIDDHRCSSR